MGLTNDGVPALSVLITGRNTRPFLKECLDSVASQTFTDFECLIADDASDDGSADAILDWITAVDDPRFRLVRFPTRLYVPSTTRYLIELARAPIVVWIGGDDLFSGPHALARIVRAYASDPEVDATYGSFLTIPKMAAWPLRLHPRGYPWWEAWSFSHVLTWRRELSLQSFAEEWNSPAYLDEHGEPYRTAGDVALFDAVLWRARVVAFIPEILAFYRLHPGNDHAQDRQTQASVEHRINAYWTERVKARAEKGAA